MSSSELFARASRVIPGGVSSPVRAFGAVGGTPVFAQRGDGAYVFDADGGRYVDYVQSWGALLFGHAREEIVEAAISAARDGTSFGMPTEREVLLAEEVVKAVPSVEQVRLVSSGTEAVMSAIRLARAFTKRPTVIKMAGCYHGHSDALLAQAGSGLATFGIPASPGVTEAATADTIVLPYNDLDAVREAFSESGDRIACVILEPVAANMGVIPPVDGYLPGLRDLTAEHGAVLVFDEVITGFRIAPGGAQEMYGVTPDLTILGKVMGGGFPCAAYGGRAEIMERVAPVGDVYQAGTLSGNPVAVAAGLAALEMIEREDPYPALERSADLLTKGITDALDERGIAHTINRAGSLFSVFFGEGAVTDFSTARAANHEAYAGFFHSMLEGGVHLPPSGYEAWFLSTAHDDEALELAVEALKDAVTSRS
ncbi:MAG TPA: glutamate-1-semialdehyde 2,1-aminomutase [Actinomycetota bacterium]|nr:glutamate-1-semialdehyde 2,1-aminomutase [Actinomycetota bacterium]